MLKHSSGLNSAGSWQPSK